MIKGALVGMIQTLVITGVWTKYDVVSLGKDEKKQWRFMAAVGIFTVLLNMLLFDQEYRIHTLVNLSAVYVIVTILAGIDLKRKVIPNAVLAVGFMVRAILMLYEWLAYPETIRQVFLNMAAGFLFGLLLLLFLSFITRHGIGYGDVKLFAWLGFSVGLADTYSILFYSVLAAAITGIYLVFVRKADKKKELPFAPFVYIGCCLVFCMTFLGD